ncbi:MAG: hypothetical protein IH914_05160 [candidate division Zixibacteria bacterium]|nr:hypothetical protein [candidate division Zixibacteria bacterium]
MAAICASFSFAGSCGGPPTPLPLRGSLDETGLVVVDCRVRIVGNPNSGFSLSDILAAIFLPEKKVEADVNSAYLGILDDSASVYEPDPYSEYLLFSGVPAGVYYLEAVFASYSYVVESDEEITGYASELEVLFDPDSMLVSVAPGGLVYVGRLTVDIERPSEPRDYESYSLTDSAVTFTHDWHKKHEKRAWKRILKDAWAESPWAVVIRARLEELE